MREVLLVNDDGLAAQGLTRLRDELSRLGKITVVAPCYEQSGSSHAITISRPLFVNPANTYQGRKGRIVSYAVRGTPVDCVKLAFAQILKRLPDLMVSGINLGANVGVDIFYSGTVAAALEAALWNINSFAISVEKTPRRSHDFRSVAQLSVKIIKSILTTGPYPGIVFNINIPCLPLNRIRGIKYTRQDLTMVKDEFSRRRDHRGRNYYLIRSELPSRHSRQRIGDSSKRFSEIISDVWTLTSGYISITPLKPDLSCYQILAKPPRVSKL